MITRSPASHYDRPSVISGFFLIRPLLLLLLLTSCGIHHGQTQDLAELKNQKALQLSGGLDARAIFYDAKGIQDRYLPFNYLISGSPVVSVYGIQIPVYFSISKQQSSFTQPFNQFGLSPRYKSLTIHAGYRNLQYSNFTLAGHTFLGGGIDWTPRKWRLSMMYGRFNKATVLDTLQGVYIENFSYRRTGFAFKAGYGTVDNFFDLIALSAKDHNATDGMEERNFLDSLKIFPAQNLANGYQARISIIKNKLILESDGALSLYTSDARSGIVEDSIDLDYPSLMKNLTAVNYSSELYAAFQASMTYKIKTLSLRLQYRYVEPNYKSMGSYFLNNDLENLTINPSLILARGKVRFTGSLGLQRDNLQKLKRATSNRVIGAANLSAEFTDQFGIDLSYTNFSNTQRARTVRFADSLRVAQSTQNFSVSPRFIRSSALHSNSVLLSFNYNQFEEFNRQRALEGTGSDIITQTYFATYQHGFLASRSSLFATLNYARLSNNLIEDKNSGLTVGGTKSFLANKIMLSLSSGYVTTSRNGAKGKILNESLQARYGIDRHNNISLMMIFLGNYPDEPSEFTRKFTEMRFEIGYGLNF
jgi:hypothetical protein